MDSRALIKLVEQDGWVLDRLTGSHHHFRHKEKPGTITIPHPSKDVPLGTERSIRRQAGLPKR